MKGWYGDKQKHSLASRGIRSKSDIENELRSVREKESNLNEELRKYAILDNIKDKYHEYIDDEAYSNMEVVKLSQDEVDELLEHMYEDEFLDIFYDGSIEKFLEENEEVVDYFRSNFEISDNKDFINQYRDYNDDDYKKPNQQSNEEYIDNLPDYELRDLFVEFLNKHTYTIEEDVKDAMREYREIEYLSEREMYDLTELAINQGMRKENDERFQPSVEEKKKMFKKAYDEVIQYEDLTDDEQEFISDVLQRTNIGIKN